MNLKMNFDACEIRDGTLTVQDYSDVNMKELVWFFRDKAITRLHFVHCSLNNDSIKELEWPTITSISLTKCNITEEGVKELVKMAANLKDLNLCRCPGLADEYIQKLTESVSVSEFQVIDDRMANSTGVTDAFVTQATNIGYKK